MISMTAFGKSAILMNQSTVATEIRSVNSRYLDCTVKLPSRYSYLEENVRSYIQTEGILRGKVDITVRIENASAENMSAIDLDAAAAYIRSLKELRDTFGLKDDISVMTVVQNPNLFVRKGAEDNPEKDMSELKAALKPAVAQFLERAAGEGERLGADLEIKLRGIEERVSCIEQNSAAIIADYRKKFEARLRTILSDESITADDSRILTECAIFADKVAIDEEIVRLRSHIVSFRDTMKKQGAVGKLLDFTVQEMNRETNTIGSKCANADIAKIVVEIKNEIEKIREQIQNIV